MEPVNNNSSTAFPLDSLRAATMGTATPEPVSQSAYTAKSYDNRKRFSGIASALASQLSTFSSRFNATTFLTGDFSWQVRVADTPSDSLVMPSATDSAEPDTYVLEIESLATAESGTSLKLASDDRADIDTGTYEFDLTVGGDTYSIELDIENDDADPLTNRELLQTVERTLAGQGADIAVEIYEYQAQAYGEDMDGQYEAVSYLTVTTSDTGEDADFSISDTSGALIETLGLDRSRRVGTNNAFSVDGNAYETDSNDVTVAADDVYATLVGTTDTGENIQIEVEQGTEALADKLTYLISEYNSFIQWLDENDSVINPSIKTALFSDIDSAVLEDTYLTSGASNGGTTRETIHVGQYAAPVTRGPDIGLYGLDSDLDEIGLSLNSDGTLDISADFETAVAGRLWDVYDTLGGDDGFFTKINAAIEDVQESGEGQYLLYRSSVLSYTDEGRDSRSIYRESGASLISMYA